MIIKIVQIERHINAGTFSQTADWRQIEEHIFQAIRRRIPATAYIGVGQDGGPSLLPVSVSSSRKHVAPAEAGEVQEL